MAGPDYSRESALLSNGAFHVAGVDEVGRGPLAGPVTAAAVILRADAIPKGLDDSKKIKADARAHIAREVRAVALVSVAHASVEEIDKLNILRASQLAMVRAVAGLPVQPCHALVDGHLLPDGLCCTATPVVRGDGACLSIAAASIVAKVVRDGIMVDLAQQHPGYGWETNAGYPTQCHREALSRLGPTPHHRRSFKPVHNML